jgi:hypothetical protein
LQFVPTDAFPCDLLLHTTLDYSRAKALSWHVSVRPPSFQLPHWDPETPETLTPLCVLPFRIVDAIREKAHMDSEIR